MPFLLPGRGVTVGPFCIGISLPLVQLYAFVCYIYLYNLYLYLSMFVVVCLYSKIGGGGFVSLYLSSYGL